VDRPPEADADEAPPGHLLFGHVPLGHSRKYWTYRGLSAALQAVPGPLAGGLASVAGLTMSQLWRDRRPVIRANLRRVVGPDLSDAALERLVTGAFDSYAKYWVESARLVAMRPAEVFRRFSIEGFDRVEEEMAKHRGAILALPHLGFWDLGGAWLTLKGYPMTTVAEALEPPDLFEWFRAQREALGLTILEFGPGTSGRLAAALRAGRLVGLVADRDLVGNGVAVEFFGEVTTLPGGSAVLALRTGAPLFPSIVYQRPGGKGHGVIRPPIEMERTDNLRADVTRLTRMLAAEFEQLIRQAPEQWHMFQPNWPSDREKYG
jgi:KDO2-lipid IV(A) lauroyltransferase